MCGTFGLNIEDDFYPRFRLGTAERLDLSNSIIFPGQDTIVITKSNKPIKMNWGFKPNWSKSLIINSKSETVAEKKTFKESFENRRCIIPVSFYFEWEKKKDKKQKYQIQTSEKYMGFAGIYEIEKDKPHFTILTRKPSSEIEFIHPRMPLILNQDHEGIWTDPVTKLDELVFIMNSKSNYELEYQAI